jgi:type III pantothenate kinase
LNLAIDIGNTRTKWGLFENKELLRKGVAESGDTGAIEELLYNHPVKNSILSSVSEAAAALTAMLRDRTVFMELDSDTPLPIANRYATPKTLGKDRLAAAAGAWALFPGERCLVIDAGTCITCDILSEEGAFLGGNISPGIDMRLKAMHAFTARLPLAERATLGHWIGNSTETALQNGAQWGALWEISALTDHCAAEFGKIKVVLTGGDANFFVKNLKREIFAHPDLVLIGLNAILINHAASHSR